ncbi:SpoIIE family protein phosphatase [Candidatus Bathyarchaeota archaeon]|nr:SpoIIE family protein phosphatase [Candidatus Bathyarchaeota archaeon]
MKRQSILPICVLLFFLLHPYPSHAHNGAVAIAVPVEGITVDGDLSDWPEGMREYEIVHQEVGDPLTGAEDFRGVFQVGYNLQENALFVAVEVEDDSVVKRAIGEVSWRTQETCEIYVKAKHEEGNEMTTQYHIKGSIPGVLGVGSVEDVKVEVQWEESGYRYEWRIDFDRVSAGQTRLQSEMIIGFDVAIWEKDEDDSSSWVTWGKGVDLTDGKLGDLVLVETDSSMEKVLAILGDIYRSQVESTRKSTRRDASYQMFFTGTLLTFTLVHLLLFAFYPAARENLYYALFTAIIAVFVFFAFHKQWQPIVFSIIFLVLASGLRFLYALFYARLPKQFWFLLAGLVGIGVVNFLVSHTSLPIPSVLYTPFLYTIAILILAVFAETLRVMIVAVVKKKEGAWIVGIGYMLFIITMIYLKFPQPQADASVMYGVICLLISMSVYLARNVARTNKNLEIQLVQVEELSAKTLKQERALMAEMEKELQTAHDMQMSLMPLEHPQVPGFGVAGRCLPASHVGGDFFKYYELPDGHLAGVLADVTGHAMEAAIPLLIFNGILESQMELGGDMETLFPRLNRSLCRSLPKRTYICLSMVELEPITRILRFSNGGCPYPYHYIAASGDIVELQVDAYPLGVRAETDYPVIEAQLSLGDRIVFCSDGIIEAENSQGEIFGFERTAETIQNGCKKDLTAPQLLDHLINEVKTFTGETPQGDDQTVVILAVEA